MSATANGQDVLSAVLTEGRVGVWTCELDVDSDDALSGAVTLDIDGVQWKGTVVRGAAVSGRYHAHLVGGAGGLAKVLDAKFYYQTQLGTVLSDIMRATGETLSATVAPAVTTHQVLRWSRNRATGGQALKQVALELGLQWRILRDGTVWLGSDSWPEASADYDQVGDAPGRGSVTIAPEAPTVGPGSLFQSRHVSAVVTRVTGSGGLRQEILFDDDTADGNGRLLAGMSAIVEGLVGNRIDYARMYVAKVVRQHSDRSLDLLCEDETMRGTGIAHVPIRHGLPGVIVQVPAGGKVLLFFENADPALPAAALWPDGTSVTAIDITAPTITIHGDLKVTGEVTALSENPATAVQLSKHLHPTAMGPSDKPLPTP